MKKLLLPILLSFNLILFSQDSFLKIIPGSENSHIFIQTVSESNTGEVYYAAIKSSIGTISSCFYKIGANGETIDSIIFNENVKNVINNYIQLPNGNYKTFLHTEGIEPPYDFKLLEYDSDMNIVSSIEYETKESIYWMGDFVNLENGNLLYASSIRHGTSNFGFDLIVYIFNQAGELLQEKKYEIWDIGGGTLPFRVYDIVETNDNNIILSTQFLTNYGWDWFKLLKLNSSLDIIDTLHVTPEQPPFLYNQAIVKSQTNYYVGGNYYDYENHIYAIAKVDFDFNVVKLITFGDNMIENLPGTFHALSYKNDYLYFLGNYDYSDYFYPQYLDVYKFDTELNEIWHKIIGSGEDHFEAYSITGTMDGGCVIVGNTTATDHLDGYVLKMNADGMVHTDKHLTYVYNAVLFPNPGKDQLNLKSTITNATFQLTNMQGKNLIKQYITQENTSFNTQKLPAGTYLWTLTQEGKVVERGKWVKD